MKKILFTFITSFLVNCYCFAQITSTAIAGKISESGNKSLFGATVLAEHTPTGTKYATATDQNGKYQIFNMKTGGPYRITASFVGFQEQKLDNIYLSLGNTFTFNFELETATNTLQEVAVKGVRGQAIDKTGVATNIGKDMIENAPTLSRSLQDMTRLTPQGGANSFAGSSYRYNNLSIDGAVNNDAFGFVEPSGGAGGSVASGTPGSLAKSQPISLDAIQELQVALSPYTVTLGNFTGASLNAVTRSGTNKTSGSVYTFGRNQAISGLDKASHFYDYTAGFRLGGAIVKNKLFYFVNAEQTNREEPVPFAPDETSAIPVSLAKAIADTLKKRYNYDAGGYGAIFLKSHSTKLFGRIDYNLNDRTQIILRHNYVNAAADQLSRATNILNFGGQGFTHHSTTNSTVLEVRSRLNSSVSNNLIVGYSDIHDYRQIAGALFPHLEITFNTTNSIFAGAYREAAIYQVKQRTFEITDNLVLYKNRHTLTLGTHNEIYNIDYHFVTPYNGRWAYSSPANFFNNLPSRIRGTYNLNNNDYQTNYDRPSAAFRVMLLSAYAQDEYSVSDALKITAGLRVESPVFPDRVPPTSDLQKTPQLAQFQNNYGNDLYVSPRIGFNYSGKKIQLRGGSGVFVGRLPFAWLAYSYIYNGSQFGNVDLRPTTKVDLVTDFNKLGALQANQREVNLVDNGFKLPTIWRSSLGFDYKINDKTTFFAEAIFTQTINDVMFKTVNLKDSTTALASGDTRNVYLGNTSTQKYDSRFTSVFVVTNTKQGFRYSLTAGINRLFDCGLVLNGVYTYGLSKDIANGVRVSPQANWEWNHTTNPNNPALSFSNFDIRHRVVASAALNHRYFGNNNTNITAIFTSQSGSPYSYTYAGDANRDGSATNDLVYVPRNQEDINLVNVTASGITTTAATQWQQLNTYIENDPYLSTRRGQFTERNGARTPWNTQLDIRITQDVKIGKQKFQISLDVINFLSILKKEWGYQYFVPNTLNSSYQLVSARGLVNNKQTYSFNNPTGTAYLVDAIASKWQGQLGLRYVF